MLRYSYTLSPLYGSTIGAYCSIAHNVDFVFNHPLNLLTTSPVSHLNADFDEVSEAFKNKLSPCSHGGNATIGSDVWIGAGVKIMPDITIGDGAIIGAGAVVTRDVPAFAVQAGVPAVTKKMRFTDAVIERIMKVRWFDYDWAGLEIHWDRDIERTLDEMENLIDETTLITYDYQYLVERDKLHLKKI